MRQGTPLAVVDYVLEVQLALEALDREPHDLVAGRRHLLHFHFAFCSDEQDFGFRIEFLKLVGDADGREDVPSRAATADDGAYLLIFHSLLHLVHLL